MVFNLFGMMAHSNQDHWSRHLEPSNQHPPSFPPSFQGHNTEGPTHQHECWQGICFTLVSLICRDHVVQALRKYSCTGSMQQPAPP